MIEIIGTVTTDGVAERFNNAADTIRARLRRTLAGLAEQVRDRARASAPVKTGTMAAGISVRFTETLTEIRATIKAPSPALFLEHGTVNHGGAHNRNAVRGKKAKLHALHALRATGSFRIQPRPFLGPALSAMRQTIEADLATAANGAAEEASQ